MSNKQCITCGEIKTIDKFYKSKKNKTGTENTCKQCRRKRQVENGLKDYLKDYHVKNRDVISKKRKSYYINNKERLSERSRQYTLNNKETINKNLREKRKENPDHYNSIRKEWCKNNKKKISDWNKLWRNNQDQEYYENVNKKKRNKYNSDPELRARRSKEIILNRKKHTEEKTDTWVISILRIRVLNFFSRNNCRKNNKTIHLIGCDFPTAINHLNSFGFNREKHDIDHIVPLSAFDVKNDKHKLIMFSYLNLKPEDPQYNRNIKRNKLTNDWKDVILKIGNARNINVNDIILYIEDRINKKELKYLEANKWQK